MVLKSKTDITNHWVLLIIFLFFYCRVIGIFFAAQMWEASQKPFWGDEKYGLMTSVREFGYGHMLIHGAQGQGSPAPLDYIVLKVFDQMKERVGYLGLRPEVYFRLWANGITCFSVIFIGLFFGMGIFRNKEGFLIKAAQAFLLLCVPFAYLFKTQVFYFAAETRPYALWNSMYFVVLGMLLFRDQRKPRWILFGFLVLLSFSATAVSFQLAAMILAFGLVRYWQERNFRLAVKEGAWLFTLPFIIVVYYCLKVGQWDTVSAGGTREEFYRLWTHNGTIAPMMLVVMGICFFCEATRKYALAPLAFLLVYLMGPFIFWMTWLKGFFFAHRQFIYYDLAVPVFLLTLLKCLPACGQSIKSKEMRWVVVVVFCVLGASLTFRGKIVKRFEKARRQAQGGLASQLVPYIREEDDLGLEKG